jgi:hypothetical protein
MSSMPQVVAAVLECARAALANTPAGQPGRVCDVPGQLAWDDCQCGLLAVSAPRLFPATRFPLESVDTDLVAPCPPPYEAAELTVTVLRCAPNPDSAGNPPTCDALAAAAVTWARDVQVLRDALGCCLAQMVAAGTVEAGVVQASAPTGPQGGCVGSETTLAVALPNCLCLANQP